MSPLPLSSRERAYVVRLLQSRTGFRTVVTLADGRSFDVVNIAPVMDYPEEPLAVTINFTPPDDKFPYDEFLVREVREIVDEDGGLLFRATDR